MLTIQRAVSLSNRIGSKFDVGGGGKHSHGEKMKTECDEGEE